MSNASTGNRMLPMFEILGVDLAKPDTGQAKGECPFCATAGHFYVNVKTGLWDCKSCGESGNHITFLTMMAEQLAGDTTRANYRKLAALRGIPFGHLERWGLAYLDGGWLIPSRGPSGSVHDLRRWQPKTGEIKSMPGCKTNLFNADGLADSASTATVYVCEGEWDAMAFDWLLGEAKQKDVVCVGVPGANTFKKAWVQAFAGRDVVICYDNDDAGLKGMLKAAGKLLNMAAEIDTSKPLDSSVMKTLTGGDPITVDVKYREPVTFVPSAKHVFAVNELPKFKDKTEAMRRRAIILPFTQKFTGKCRDPHLVDKLRDELPGILNWALRGLRDLTRRKCLYESPIALARKDDFIEMLDPALAFVRHACKLIADGPRIRRRSLYINYEAWHRQTIGERPLKVATFYERLRENFPEVRDVRINGMDYFLGIKVLKPLPALKREKRGNG